MKLKLKQLFPLLLFLLITGICGAQEVLSFSLAEAKEYALRNSYVVRNSGLDVEAAKKKVWETIADGLPQISGSAAYNNYLDLPTQLIPGDFIGQPGTYVEVKFGQDYDSHFGFTINQLIFDGSYIVGVGSAKIYLQLADQNKEKAELDIWHSVEQAYYSVLVAEENLVVMKENLANSQKLEKDTRLMYQNGFVEEQDVDQMLLLVQKAENEILKTEREIRVARMVLKYTMGIDMDVEVRLTEKLEKFVQPLVTKEGTAPEFDFTTHIDYRLLDTQRQANKKLLLNEKSEYQRIL